MHERYSQTPPISFTAYGHQNRPAINDLFAESATAPMFKTFQLHPYVSSRLGRIGGLKEMIELHERFDTFLPNDPATSYQQKHLTPCGARCFAAIQSAKRRERFT